MKKIIILVFLLNLSCAANQGVYWCGDHPCINKKEREAYFKKTMIVEFKNMNRNQIKKDSEIEKLLKQAKIDEKNRILTEKEIKKRKKEEEKELQKELKLEKKRRINEEKKLAKQVELEEKKRKKDEKKYKKNEKNKKANQNEKNLEVATPVGNFEISANEFDEIVENIIKRNRLRPYPEINDIPK